MEINKNILREIHGYDIYTNEKQIRFDLITTDRQLSIYYPISSFEDNEYEIENIRAEAVYKLGQRCKELGLEISNIKFIKGFGNVADSVEKMKEIVNGMGGYE